MKTTSQKQIIANKENGKKGGVKTPEGKEVSKYNAQKHCVLRETVTEYEQIDFESVFNDLADMFNPQNRLEEMMIERIAVIYIKLARLSKVEGEQMRQHIDPTIGYGESMVLTERDGYKPVVPAQTVEYWLKVMSRYETATENRFYKAIDKLRDIKKMGSFGKVEEPVD